MTSADLAESLVPLAAELVGTVRDYGPDDVAAVLARVPEGRHDALAVVLAAMVDPDSSPLELLGWINGGPVQSRPNLEHPTRRDRVMRKCPDCGREYRASHLARHRRTHAAKEAA